MKRTKKKAPVKEPESGKPSGTTVQRDINKDAVKATTYFWQDPNNRNLLRKCHKASEKDDARQDSSVLDHEVKPNLYVHRTTTHRTISRTMYRRQKRKS